MSRDIEVKRIELVPSMVRAVRSGEKTMLFWPCIDQSRHDAPPLSASTRSPLGRAGDLVYVLEDWSTDAAYDTRPASRLPKESPIHYIADGRKPAGFGRTRGGRSLPQACSRLTLLIESLRCHRLRELSENDAIAIGARVHMAQLEGLGIWPRKHPKTLETAVASLWCMTHPGAARLWAENGWVWLATVRYFNANVTEVATKTERQSCETVKPGYDRRVSTPN